MEDKKIKRGDKVYCKKHLKFSLQDDCYPGKYYEIEKLNISSKWRAPHYLIGDRPVFLDQFKEYFYTKKELRKVKLKNINEIWMV